MVVLEFATGGGGGGGGGSTGPTILLTAAISRILFTGADPVKRGVLGPSK